MSAQEVVDNANRLAWDFYGMHGYQAKDGFRFDKATHPQEQLMWRMAVRAFEVIEGTEVEDALDELNELEALEHQAGKQE